MCFSVLCAHPSLRVAPGGGSVIRTQNGGGTMDVFSRSGMNVVAVLLLILIAFAVYVLWDVAIERWFG
jgi:hypothetical protein